MNRIDNQSKGNEKCNNRDLKENLSMVIRNLTAFNLDLIRSFFEQLLMMALRKTGEKKVI